MLFCTETGFYTKIMLHGETGFCLWSTGNIEGRVFEVGERKVELVLFLSVVSTQEKLAEKVVLDNA